MIRRWCSFGPISCWQGDWAEFLFHKRDRYAPFVRPLCPPLYDCYAPWCDRNAPALRPLCPPDATAVPPSYDRYAPFSFLNATAMPPYLLEAVPHQTQRSKLGNLFNWSLMGMRRRLIYGKEAGGVLKRDPNKAEPHRCVRDNLYIHRAPVIRRLPANFNTLCIKRIIYNPNLADSSMSKKAT